MRPRPFEIWRFGGDFPELMPVRPGFKPPRGCETVIDGLDAARTLNDNLFPVTAVIGLRSQKRLLR